MKTAILLLVGGLAGPLAAQTVYRCGTAEKPVYSQAPCADGKAVDVSDPRTAAQRADSLEATKRQAAAAERMRKERLAEEAALAKAREAQEKKEKAKARKPAGKASAAKGKGDSEGAEEKKKPVREPVYIFPPKPARKASS